MKFGVREICDVVLKAKATQKVGNKIFYKNGPVIYFDTLKTSSMEGAATTVYAQGGRGNSRLIAWEGERTLTFTMEDALISPAGFMILSGAGLVEAGDSTPIYVHTTETTTVSSVADGVVTINLTQTPYVNGAEDLVYVMFLDENGEVVTEPYIPSVSGKTLTLQTGVKAGLNGRIDNTDTTKIKENQYTVTTLKGVKTGTAVLVDFYVEKKSGAQQIEITPDKFGGNYYLEASTLFRDAATGVDMPAEFIIPNCKIQSNFTFTMASSGDPSSFTFTMYAFPGYTRFDNDKKVLAAIQIISTGNAEEVKDRTRTSHDPAHEKFLV